SRIELVLAQQDFYQFFAQLPVLRRAGFMMIDYRVGKPVQQVGTADDTHEPAVAEHRDTLDVMALQQFGDFIERRVLVHGKRVSRHYRPGGAAQRLFVGHRLASEDRLQPPRTPPPGATCLGAQQVALADNADDLSRAVDDRYGTDPVLQQQTHDVVDRRV